MALLGRTYCGILASLVLLSAAVVATESVNPPATEHEDVERVEHSTTYQTSHNGVFHLLMAIQDGYVTLEDGSIWRLRETDRWRGTVYHWTANDYIIIAPNQSFWPTHPYRLINQTTDETVYVDLHQVAGFYPGAWPPTAYTRRLIGINYHTHQVILDDQSVWEIADSDILVYWAPDDTVVLGMNDGWSAVASPNILINYRTHNHARGYRSSWL